MKNKINNLYQMFYVKKANKIRKNTNIKKKLFLRANNIKQRLLGQHNLGRCNIL